MKPVRTLAHAMLASVFIAGAARTLRDPERAVQRATPISDRITPMLEKSAPWVPTTPAALVRANAGLQLVGGLLLVTGRAPRLASVALAGSLVPSTIASHPYWRAGDVDERASERKDFMKNLALLGGLLLAAVDTQGRPGLRWRASHVSRHASRKVKRARKGAGRTARSARRQARTAATAASVGRRLPR
ncbi:MAG: DoxX family membrane protein [Actinocatenispora sp.]